LKLLYILSEYLPDSGGGIISHYARILPGLAARGHEVTVILASKGNLDQPDYEIDGVRVRPLKAKFLEQYASREDVDLIVNDYLDDEQMAFLVKTIPEMKRELSRYSELTPQDFEG
jgi:LmbE family N-acetylglucosaminyl deacetylase